MRPLSLVWNINHCMMLESPCFDLVLHARSFIRNLLGSYAAANGGYSAVGLEEPIEPHNGQATSMEIFKADPDSMRWVVGPISCPTANRRLFVSIQVCRACLWLYCMGACAGACLPACLCACLPACVASCVPACLPACL